MLREHVSDYAELHKRVSELEPPPAGTVRVFRGQAQDFSLVPSGRRRKVPRASIWAHYSRQMIMSLQRKGPDEDFQKEAQLWMVWLQALAQHYGAGSNYLDVTHDLGAAAWFAFHTSSAATLKTVVGPPGDSSHDSTVQTEWIRLSPHPGPAYVYVLDLEPWDTKDLPDAGQIVDLKDAPELFHSARIEVQSGCLVWADENEDLKSRAIREFVVEQGVDAPYASWSVEQIFPPPSEDTWYGRFLTLPFLVDAEADGDSPHLGQSLPVTLFLSAPDSPYVADIRSKFRYLLPSPVYEELSDMAPAPPNASPIDTLFAAATPIVLEGPQISAHPPVEDTSWNHELLLSDWSMEVDAFDKKTDESAGRVDLSNALIEFSPLDQTGWFEGEPITEAMLRAVWIIRDRDGGDGLTAYLFMQSYPVSRFERLGPIYLRLGAGRRLEYALGQDGKPWADIADLAIYGKAIVSCLVLLRDCSPIPKAAAYPQLVAGGDEGWNMVVPLSSSAARLYRAAASGAQPWYVLRHPDGEPYTVAQPNLGGLSLRNQSKSFGDLSAEEIRGYITANAASSSDSSDSTNAR